MEISKKILKTRAQILAETRKFFSSCDFTEVDTPTLVFSPGMEPHIRPVQIEEGLAFLQTSPEFAMKRILASGWERIFQICKSYRFEPKSDTHHPEFTMLEWYRTQANYKDLMKDVESWFEHLATALHGKTEFLDTKGELKSVQQPWPRLTIEECFEKFLGLHWEDVDSIEKISTVCRVKGFLSSSPSKEISADFWNDCFFSLMLNGVEPELKKINSPVILYNYPASQAALANVFTDEKGRTWAKRFEVYAGGFELGNAFDELIDPIEQRKRFIKDQKVRKEIYGDSYPASPIDEDFLNALEKMPPCSGIAVGMDRVVMYFTGAESIRDVLWQESYFKS